MARKPTKKDENSSELPAATRVESASGQGANSGDVNVRLQASSAPETPMEYLWRVIRDRTEAIGFDRYTKCMNSILCDDQVGRTSLDTMCDEGGAGCVSKEPPQRVRFGVHGPDAYLILKAATECFLMQECGRLSEAFDADTDQAMLGGQDVSGLKTSYLDMLEREGQGGPIPYFHIIRQRLGDLPLKDGLALGYGAEGEDSCYGILRSRVESPCFIEYIWSYWHEESMVVQAMKALAFRFQNIRKTKLNDPLSRLSIDPLRPLNNLMWGFIQDERSRLSVARRAYEYEHQYGIGLLGDAAGNIKPIDRRSTFMEAFHELITIVAAYFKQADDLTVRADGFPVLNALKDVHRLLAEGADNQYGDLPWNSRVEMLIMMWILGRPELREFLGGRATVPYSEPWMDRVDTMKSLQGWTNTSSTVFSSLAKIGERLLLSIRFTNWSTIDDPNVAANWANFWRSDILSYAHSYRSATGVEILAPAGDAQAKKDRALAPALHLRKRLAGQKTSGTQRQRII